MKNKKILLIGPYPPPYGGVSVHIKRLKSLLSGGFDVDIVDEGRNRKDGIFNLRSLNIGRYLRKVFAADIVHIHSGLFFFRAFHFSIARLFFKKTIITIHGYEPRKGDKVRVLDSLILNNCNKVIFVTKELAAWFRIKKHLIKDAFLPPDLNDEQEIPGEVINWIEKKKLQGYSISIANAWRLDSHNNEDLYGLDLCIDAAKKLKARGIKAAFVFVVCDNAGVIKIDPYKQIINYEGMEDYFLLWEAPLSFVKLILKSDIVLRPTNTDGDALTVREGMFLGKTVIASDVVPRPRHTILFKNRDADSLAQTIADFKMRGQNNTETSPETVDSIAYYKAYYNNNIYN